MNRFVTPLHNHRPRATAAVFGAAEWNSMILPVCLLAMLAFLVTAYLVLMNALTQKTFEMKALDNTLVEMKRDNARLEVKSAEAQSLANLSERVAELGMVPTSRIEYVTAVSGVVALR